jgi:hypothetical protein
MGQLAEGIRPSLGRSPQVRAGSSTKVGIHDGLQGREHGLAAFWVELSLDPNHSRDRGADVQATPGSEDFRMLQGAPLVHGLGPTRSPRGGTPPPGES